MRGKARVTSDARLGSRPIVSRLEKGVGARQSGAHRNIPYTRIPSSESMAMPSAQSRSHSQRH
jgi:hypothetical protein